jgi:LmbE family N-acetylglucosaminyl deacetylase
MPALTVISPHQDDAGLSLAMTLRSAARQGHPARIINCFTISAYAPHAEAQTVPEIAELRRSEDREFIARTGASVQIVDLGLEDAPIRLGCPVNEVRRRRMGRREREEAMRLATEIGRLAEGILLAPLGLGGHIDHLVAHEAGVQLAKTGHAVAFYEDLPYAADLRECCILRAADNASRCCGTALSGMLARDPEGAARKRFAIEAYRSQLAESQFDSVIGYGKRRGGAERIWTAGGTEKLIPAALENTGITVGRPVDATRRRAQCAVHRTTDRIGRYAALLNLRGGGVNAPQAI